MCARKKVENIKITKKRVNGVINGAGEIIESKIVETLEKNYMPYAMSVIMSRAIPEIDGFKPSHRKLLYTMYKMGLLDSQRTKSANIVGQTMKLNPHGDAAIYDTMVRLSRGHEALLHPYIDSKGNFGKFYSRDMAYAASRYTEARLDDIAKELFADIDKDTIDFVDNYDNTIKEPTLLPARFPSVLVNANTGIAVGMASSICPFNLREVCDTTINLIKDPNCDLTETLIAPDFPGGGQLIYDSKVINEIYKTGKGSFKVRARYEYDKDANCIDIKNIPPTTSTEAIIEKIVDLVKQNKMKEISDVRDETGIDGLKITIDLKRGTDPDKLMQKLYKMTSLEDTFSCNFNILIGNTPRVMGVREILQEWIAFRVECVKRRTKFELDKKSRKLHLLKGLKSILLDIDKAISIIRETNEEVEVIPNLMIGFHIDEEQAEYVVDIKLRHLNKEYIIKRTNEIDDLESDILNLESILNSERKVKKIISHELLNISKGYGKPRNTMLIYPNEIQEYHSCDEVEDYQIHVFLSKDGYLKKIMPQSLRMNSEHKLKEGDEIVQSLDITNKYDLLFFTNQHKVYKVRISDFQEVKASAMGEYIPAKLSMDEGESIVYMVATKDYSGYMLFFFDCGRFAKVSMDLYSTKTNRKKLVGAYCEKFNLVYADYVLEDAEYLVKSTENRLLIFHTGAFQVKSTRNTQGVLLMTLKKDNKVQLVRKYDGSLENPNRYRTKSYPALGAKFK